MLREGLKRAGTFTLVFSISLGMLFGNISSTIVLKVGDMEITVVPSVETAYAQVAGDALLVYGTSTTAAPGYRTWATTTQVFSAESLLPDAAANIKHVVVKSSPVRPEMMVGVQSSGGTLYVYRWNGSLWSSEWNVSVGDSPIQRFDIAYEYTSGDALVVYSGNAATTNELRYRKWNGYTWTPEQNLDTVRTSQVVHAVQMQSYQVANSNAIGLAWGTDNVVDVASSTLSANYWNGNTDTWTGEPGVMLSGRLAVDVGVWSTVSTWAFDLAFETLSGDLMVVWGDELVNNLMYIVRSAGEGGTWDGATSTATAFAEEPIDIELESDPASDGIVYVNNSPDTGNDAEAAWWTGSAWPGAIDATPPCEETSVCGFDASVDTTGVGTSNNSVAFLVNGSERRAVVTFDDANAVGIDWVVFNPANVTNNWAVQTDCTTDCSSQPAGTDDRLHRNRVNPFQPHTMMFIGIDSNADLFAKQLVFDGTNFKWSNADGGSALEASISLTAPGLAADFAYDRVLPTAPARTVRLIGAYAKLIGGRIKLLPR